MPCCFPISLSHLLFCNISFYSLKPLFTYLLSSNPRYHSVLPSGTTFPLLLLLLLFYSLGLQTWLLYQICLLVVKSLILWFYRLGLSSNPVSESGVVLPPRGTSGNVWYFQLLWLVYILARGQECKYSSLLGIILSN